MTDAVEPAETPTERFLVTMRSAFMLPDGSISTHEATDHVATSDLEAYVADAQTRWQAVIVADQPDEHEATADYTVPDIAPQEG